MDLLSMAKLMPVRSTIAQNAKARCGARIERPADVVLDLRLLPLPQSRELSNRIVISPVNPKVHDRPTYIAHNEQPCGVDRASLAAGFDTREKGLQETRCEM